MRGADDNGTGTAAVPRPRVLPEPSDEAFGALIFFNLRG